MKFINIGSGEAVFICDHNIPNLFDIKCEKCENKREVFTFDEAIILFRRGEKIRRKIWCNHWFLHQYSKSSLHGITKEDLINDDWEILND